MAKMASLQQELATQGYGLVQVRKNVPGSPQGTCYSTGAPVVLEGDKYIRLYQFDEGDQYNFGLSEGEVIVRDDHHGWVIAQSVDFEDVA